MASGGASGGGGREYKVVLVGSPKVGKTSLIQRFVFDEFSYDVPQTGPEEKKTVELGKGKCVDLRIVDLIGMQLVWGQSPLQLPPCFFKEWLHLFFLYKCCILSTDRTDLVTRKYYEDAEAVIFVYDVTNPDTLSDSQTWIKDIRFYLNEKLSRGNFPILFVGNKRDLVKRDVDFIGPEGEGQEQDEAEYITLKQVRSHTDRERFLKPMECSACTGSGVKEVFEKIAKELIGEKSTRSFPCTIL